MASGGHLLQQQKPHLENAIKLLTNAKLQEICRTYGEAVSGTKAVLQRRCLNVLESAVRRGDVIAFEDLRRRANLDSPSPFSPNRFQSPSTSYNSPGYQPFNMAPQRGGGGLQGQRPGGGKYFKPSPFYETIDTVLTLQDLPEGPEMPQNRHTVRANFTINPDLAQQCRNENNVKILMYCGLSHGISPFSQVDIAFPNQIEVKINDQDIKHNFKGLKNKPGSTKPADVTGLVRKMNSQNNSIQLTYALTNKRYAYMIYAVRYISAERLTERLKRGNAIPRDKVLRDMSKANADPDIAATSVRMSLKDPISTVRITLPVRASHCTHNQCFDGAMFLQLQEQAPQWSCPVCSKNVSFESLCVDRYFEDILSRTSRSIEKVDIEPNGEWRVIKEDEDQQPNGNSSRNARASYDDDFDDDIVELDQPAPGNKQINGIKAPGQHGMLSPSMGQPFMNTPPLSSRETSVAQSASSAPRSNKRPQSVIVDLTLSDDEDDDPPRPAKRQSMTQNSSQRTQNSYHSTNSLPDFPRAQPTRLPQLAQVSNAGGNSTSFGGGGADNYRPNSNTQNAQQQQQGQPSRQRPESFSLNNYNSNSSNNCNTNHTNNANPPPSPMRASPYNSTGWPGRTPSNHNSNTNNMNFTIRPPPSTHQSSISPPVHNAGLNGASAGDPGGGAQIPGLRLPPIQQQQPSVSVSPDPWSGWRDVGGWGDSPGPGGNGWS